MILFNKLLFSTPLILLSLYVCDIFAQYNPNTNTYASTVNFKDGGKTYEYVVNNGAVFLRKSNGAWVNLHGPCQGRIVNVAADNNRLLALTRDGQLYWYCPQLDKAEWVITMLDIAIKADGSALTKQITTALKAAIGVKSFQDYKNWVINSHQPGTWNRLETLDKTPRFPALSSQKIIDIAVGNWYGTVSTFYVLTRNTNGTGGHIYWIDEEPISKDWKEINGKKDRVAESFAWGVAWDALSKASYPAPLTGPFALTALAYSNDALVDAHYYYSTTGQAVLVPPTQQLNTKDITFGNSPNNNITDESRINASNSVICVSTRDASTNNVVFKYIRLDYHHQPDFSYWPAVDWAETAWHSYSTAATTDMKNFNFSTHAPNVNPANAQGPWKIPPFAGSVELFVVPLVGPVSTNYSIDFGGFFGTGVYQWDINYYPTRFFTRTNNETVTVRNSMPNSVQKKYQELDLPLSLATCLVACVPVLKDTYKAKKYAVNDGPPVAGIFQAEQVNDVTWSEASSTYQDPKSSRKFPIYDPMVGIRYYLAN